MAPGADELTAAAPWPPAERDPVLSRLRAALRDPFHRNEQVQARTFHPLVWLIVAVPVLAIPHLWAALPVIAMIAAAEGAIREAERGTWDSLLMTPIDRGRLLWCKLLGRIRPVLRMAAVIPVCCAAIGGCLGLLLPDARLLVGETEPLGPAFSAWAGVSLGALAGLVGGAVLALLIWGECLTAGAIGLYFGLRFPRRVIALVLAAPAMLALHALEFLLISGAWLAVAGALHSAMSEVTTAAALSIAFVTVALAVRIAVVNVLLPYGLMAHCACHLDRWLLREKDAPAMPRPLRGPDG